MTMNTASSSNSNTAGMNTELFLAVQKHAFALHEQLMELIRPHQLSSSQYNILRILRGAGENGCTCSEIAERMISKDPDITRLLDRLEGRNLINRARSETDRRVVKSFITNEGSELLKTLDQPIAKLHEEQFNHLSPTQKQQLLKLLDS